MVDEDEQVTSAGSGAKRGRPSDARPADQQVAPRETVSGEVPTCPLCGGLLSGRHCNLVCPNCGYTEDCTDLFPA
jgi:rubrerythrin